MGVEKETDIGVRHYKTGSGGWQVGFSHYWLRLRGLFSALGLTVVTMGSPWWWPDGWGSWKNPATVTISVFWIALISTCLTVSLVLGPFLYARKRAQRSVDCKDKLHIMSHTMRDAFCELLSRTVSRTKKHDPHHEKRHLIDSSNAIAQSIVEYLQSLTGSKCIGVVIRIADDEPNDGKDQSLFVAVGRAGSTNLTRAKTSEPIPGTEGIPKLFKSEKFSSNGRSHGVLFFHDLKKAIDSGIYKQTDNERQFPEDYSCAIAIPLNGFNGEKMDLIGILTITARSKKALLKVHHVDLFKAIGDRLAEHYSATVARLATKNRMPTFR